MRTLEQKAEEVRELREEGYSEAIIVAILQADAIDRLATTLYGAIANLSDAVETS